jgi:hypothetical protein
VLSESVLKTRQFSRMSSVMAATSWEHAAVLTSRLRTRQPTNGGARGDCGACLGSTRVAGADITDAGANASAGKFRTYES